MKAFRTKIDQVLKFEVESELPQFDIDDVVVDYHVLSENDAGAELLVTAVPRVDVQGVIALCEKAGIEPLEIELEATAMVNAAFTADICHIDDAQLLVHVGEYSTCVAVVAGAELREFRVIHIGAMTHLMRELDEVATEDAEDVEVNFDEGGELSEGLSAFRENVDVNRKVDQAVTRIKRELGRTISAARTPQTIDAIYASGTELPGLIGSETLGVPIYVLDCFEGDSGQPADGFGQLVAAYGGAVGQLGGGVIKPSLRRDDLKYTGTWEKLEFPIAVAALMLATFLGLLNIIQYKQLSQIAYRSVIPFLRTSNTYVAGADKRPQSDPIMRAPKPPRNGDEESAEIKDIRSKHERLRKLTERYYRYDRLSDFPDGIEEPLDAFRTVERAVTSMAKSVDKVAGGASDVELPPSAFNAMALLLNVMRSDADWRPSVRKFSIRPVAKKGDLPEHCSAELVITFFAMDSVEATTHAVEFQRQLELKPWCLGVEPGTNEAIEGSGGVHYKKFKVLIVPNLAAESPSN